MMFATLSLSQKKIIYVGIVLIALHQFYLYQYTPPLIDEVYAWLYSCRQGLWIALSTYSTSMLYSILTAFCALFVPEAVLAMRLASLLIFWCLLGIIFVHLNKEVSFNVAFLAVILVGLGFSTSIFSVQGRGYILLSFCGVLSVFYLFYYLKNYDKKFIYYFALWNILGHFASPVFIYNSIGIYGFIVYHFLFLLKRSYLKKVFQDVLIATLLIIAGTFLLYLPMLTQIGMQGFIAMFTPQRNTWLVFITYTLPICLRESIVYLIALPKYVALLFFSSVVGLYAYQYTRLSTAGKMWGQFLCVSSVFTLIFIICTKTFPFYRVWTCYSVLFAIALAFLLDNLFQKKLKPIYINVLACLFFVSSILQFEYAIQDFYEKDTVKNCKQLKNAFQALAQKNAPVWLSEDAFYGEFWFRQAGKTHLLVGKPCEAKYAVSAHDKPLPACYQTQYKIWFLYFLEKTK